MSAINQDLQASYQIINILEKSKANSESVIDGLPDLFAIVDREGQILKGNRSFSKKLSVNDEDLLGSSLSSLFTEESWRLFRTYLAQAQALNPGDKPVEFELPIDYQSENVRICYWTLDVLEVSRRKGARLYCLIGRDITLLRAYQKQLAEIFASIPLGIFTVSRDGRIDDAVSAYTNWLLGTDRVAGRTLKELLVDPSIEYTDTEGREGWRNVLNAPQFTLREFDLLAETFPKQFYYPLPGSKGKNGRYLGIKVQSIAHGNQVSGLLILLEDRTSLVEAEKADEKQKLMQDLNVQRALQIKKCDPDLLTVVLNDLKTVFSQVGDAILMKDESSFKNGLHSIKGNARLAGFKSLTKMAHALESRLSESGQNIDWQLVYSNFDELRHEWKEILSLATVLSEVWAMDEEKKNTEEVAQSVASLTEVFERFEKAVSANTSPEAYALGRELRQLIRRATSQVVVTFESSLRSLAQLTADRLSKKARLVFEWEKNLRVEEAHSTAIRTCLMHLVTNALDHGIENPESRSEAGKNPVGVIKIDAYTAGTRMVFTVEDDGRGLDPKAIGASAVKKGVITAAALAKMGPMEIRELIFAPGFSTADTVTEISGRGVGLSAVRELVEKIGGEVRVMPSKLGGASFRFMIPNTLEEPAPSESPAGTS